MIKIVFNCNQTKMQGLGHFSRCLNFARHLKIKKKFDISFIGMFSTFSLSILQKEDFKVYSLICDEDLFIGLKKYDYIITDRYDIDQDHLDKIASFKDIKSIIIDDFNTLNFSNHDLVVNFRVGVNHYRYDSKTAALGEKFFIFKPELSQIRENYKFNSTVKRILFFGTGTNKSNIKFNDLPEFLIQHFPHLEIVHATNEPLDIKSRRYISKPLSNSFENYFKKVDATINGGGLIKYEVSFCGIPSATLSTTKDQHLDTEILSKKGLLYNLGNQQIENKAKIQKRVINFINDPKTRQSISQKGKIVFTPESINNLINRIYEL